MSENGVRTRAQRRQENLEEQVAEDMSDVSSHHIGSEAGATEAFEDPLDGDVAQDDELDHVPVRDDGLPGAEVALGNGQHQGERRRQDNPQPVQVQQIPQGLQPQAQAGARPNPLIDWLNRERNATLQTQAATVAALQRITGGRKDIKPQRYDGSTSWYSFLKHFFACARHNGWPEDRWVTEIGPYLTGDAASAYEIAAEVHPVDFNAFKAKVAEQLGEGPHDSRGRMSTFTLSLNVDFRKEGRRMLQDMRNIAPEQTPESILFYARDKFYDALPESIREKVTDLYLRGTNFYELITHAEHHRQQLLKKKSPTTTVNQVSTTSLQTNAQVNPGPTSGSATGMTDGNPPGAARPFQGKCWNCGNEGHTRRLCTAPRQTGQGRGRGRGSRQDAGAFKQMQEALEALRLSQQEITARLNMYQFQAQPIPQPQCQQPHVPEMLMTGPRQFIQPNSGQQVAPPAQVTTQPASDTQPSLN